MLLVDGKSVPNVVGSQAQVPGKPDKASDCNGAHDFEYSNNHTSHGLEEGPAIAVISRSDFVHICKSQKRKKWRKIRRQQNRDKRKSDESKKVLDSHVRHRWLIGQATGSSSRCLLSLATRVWMVSICDTFKAVKHLTILPSIQFLYKVWQLIHWIRTNNVYICYQLTAW